MFSTISSDWGIHFAGQVIQTLAKKLHEFLGDYCFHWHPLLLGKGGRQRDWLHEIEQTAKHDYNFHDFLSDILLASNFCFQI